MLKGRSDMNTNKNIFLIYTLLGALGMMMVYPKISLAVPNGVYISGLLGSADLKYSTNSQHVAPASKDADHFAWRVDAGYKYNPNLAIELGYINWPDTNFKNVLGSDSGKLDITQRSADLMGVFSYPINAAASIYAKGGITYIKATKDVNQDAHFLGVNSKKVETFNPIFGLGGNYEFYPNLLAELSWLRIPSGSGIATSDFFGIGLTFFVG